ncbi:Gfo/Idh/MocA family oxidoreductase [Alphaproteobacteria bacterium KMM 3653]|uniref:Gfo/Idh/MocA family oxidoreductase n=1 Tax=Harenicola maris TaxID=2841044 RepID=A0AAP2CM87_9RHOB|nr:Gfo/Idh/MocA family oxidoreductase [Harenicola maris]
MEKMAAVLIGAGMIGESHVRALSGLRDQIGLAAVVTRRPEGAMYLAEHYAGERPVFTADLEAVLADPAVRMVIVATPPSVRIDLIAAIAAAGKHVLLEKPVARNLAEAEEVVKICADAGVSLGMVLQHRASLPAKAAAELVAGGTLGALGHVEIIAQLWRDQSYYDELGRGTYARDGGGVLLTQAIHSIDLALSLTSPVSEVQAMTCATPLHQLEAEDMAVVGLRFACGAAGSLVASTASFPGADEMVKLHFSHGSLAIGRRRLDIHWRDGRHEVVGYGIGDAGPSPENYIWHQGVIADFAEAITQGSAPMATGEAALAAHRLIDAIERSSRSGAKVMVGAA